MSTVYLGTRGSLWRKALRNAGCRCVDVFALNVCAPACCTFSLHGCIHDFSMPLIFSSRTSKGRVQCGWHPETPEHTALYSLSPGQTMGDSPINLNADMQVLPSPQFLCREFHTKDPMQWPSASHSFLALQDSPLAVYAAAHRAGHRAWTYCSSPAITDVLKARPDITRLLLEKRQPSCQTAV